MKKGIIALAVVILAALFLSTFVEENKMDKDKNEDNIVMSVEGLNLNLDKVSNLTKDDENIICATCRGMVKLNNSNEVILDLAKDLEVSSDGIEYKFILRDDIYWSNGEKIKPEEVLIYFKTLIQNEDNENIEALLNVYGVDKFKQGVGTFEKDVAITCEEDIIKMRLNKRNDDFLAELSKPQYRLRRNLYLWDDVESNYNRIVYSGDYSISNVNDNSIELKNNKSAEGKKIIMIKDYSKEDSMASYEIGDRDIVVDVPVSQVARLDKNKRILSSSSGEGIYIAINSEKLDLGARKDLVKKLYKAAEDYYDQNKKAVKFSEGSYFEEEMDDLDKLQSRKVSMTNSKESELPQKIKVLINNDDVVEDFTKFATEYFSEEEYGTIVCEEKEEDELVDYTDFDMVVLRLKENASQKNELYSGMQQVFSEENKRYFTDVSKMEENLFNSYTVLPVMFVNRNIAVSDKVSNVRIDGNGNVDFSGLD